MRIDIELPIDLESERLLLGSLMAALPRERGRIASRVTPEAFSDEFHQWLFRGILEHPRLDGKDLLQAILRRPRPDWMHGQPVAYWIARLFTDWSGDSTCGDVRDAQQYVMRVRKVSASRRKMIDILGELETLSHEYDTDQVPIPGIAGQRIRHEAA